MHQNQGGTAVSTMLKPRTSSNLEALGPLYAELNKAGETKTSVDSTLGAGMMNGIDTDTPAAQLAHKNHGPINNTHIMENDGAGRDVEEQKSSAPAKRKTVKKKRSSKDATPDGETPIGKRKRFTWSDDLHKQFMATIFDIGLIHAKPKSILQSMAHVPPNLTTEHIKSHLQKYRANSKRTQELFQQQFEFAKRQAEQYSDGKALNPVFHAYPMPIGNFPMGDVSFLEDNAGPNAGAINGYGDARQNYGGHGGMHTNLMIPGGGGMGYNQANNNQAMGSPGNFQNTGRPPVGYSHAASTVQGQMGSPSHAPSHQPGMHISAAANNNNNNKGMVFEQMEAQMRIHAQIQQQHEMQQSQRKSMARTDAGSDMGRSAATSAGTAPGDANSPHHQQHSQMPQAQQQSQHQLGRLPQAHANGGKMGLGLDQDNVDMEGMPYPSPFLGALPPDKPLTPLSLNDADKIDDVVLNEDLFDFLY
ncbi:Two-component response regulator ARR2 [Hondaea fermentalgiana]|uniref:Two-component response regulator ARR2 n=1 Tax=Hondaea fermentalgiana TaxID=2315210 RepID=A0A2R5GEK2_9STRA|nr:Two-component response regulator ARR2 [Hondaea fermentalgiana]|eukprot:GBG26661.1 Two-component response regulator ARR2 [Hondaea fermentalgiana]